MRISPVLGRLGRSQVHWVLGTLLTNVLARDSVSCKTAMLGVALMRQLIEKLGLPAVLDCVFPAVMQLLTAYQRAD